MSEVKKVIVDGQEYNIYNYNAIQSSDIAFASFSGYMAFSGQLSEEVLEKFGDAGAKLIGKKINAIFSISSGVIDGIFDLNMNPDESLGQIFIERGVEFAFGEAGANAV
jgi:hypothetical protein